MQIQDNIKEIVKQALMEDVGDGDHSSLSCISGNIIGRMKLLAKENGILAGVEVAKEVIRQVDETITMEVFIHDGEAIKVGDVVFELFGPARSMLTAERTLLNFMQRLSGVLMRLQVRQQQFSILAKPRLECAFLRNML